MSLPFGVYRQVPLPEVPSSYLAWALEVPKLSSGLRAALSAELQSRGLTPPPAPPTPAPPRCQRCPGAGYVLSRAVDAIGRPHVRATCQRCGRHLAFVRRDAPDAAAALKRGTA
jgi:hypothetical protein